MLSKSRFFVALLALCFGCAFAQEGKLAQAIGVADLNLTAAQVQVKSREAMEGSISAASSLINYYCSVRLDFVTGMKWALIGAENGDPNIQYTVYHMLMDSKDELDHVRAMYWLNKAASAGYGPAIEELKIAKNQDVAK